MKPRFLVLSIMAFSLLFLWGCQKSTVPGTNEAATINSTAPSFVLRDLNGRPISLSQFKGKVVVLDFWATWCNPCREEIPHFVDLYDKYKGKDFTVLGVSVDDEGATVVKPFVQQFHVDYPVVLADDKVQTAYGPLNGIPTTFIIDKSGKIVEKFIGYRDISLFEEKIQKLL